MVPEDIFFLKIVRKNQNQQKASIFLYKNRLFSPSLYTFYAKQSAKQCFEHEYSHISAADEGLGSMSSRSGSPQQQSAHLMKPNRAIGAA